jgi:hypothetical protein
MKGHPHIEIDNPELFYGFNLAGVHPETPFPLPLAGGDKGEGVKYLVEFPSIFSPPP